MATTTERSGLRELLLNSGFEVVEKTRDRGDGTYYETFQNGQNEIEIRWGPTTDDRLEFPGLGNPASQEVWGMRAADGLPARRGLRP